MRNRQMLKAKPKSSLCFCISAGWSGPSLSAYWIIGCWRINWRTLTYFVADMQADLVHISLRKHAYSNILKSLPPKNENFQIKNLDIFHTSAQNIDCGYSLEPHRRGGSNEYQQSMFCCSKHRLWVLVRTASSRRDEAVLTSTHNLCFEQKLEKKCVPL